MRRALMVALLAIACGKSGSPPSGGGSAGSATATSTSSGVASLVERLRSKDDAVRAKAKDELREASFSGDEALEALRASTTDFGDGSDALFPTAAHLVIAVKPDPHVTPVIEQLFPTWSPATKSAGLNLLSRIGDDAATKLFVRLLPTVSSGDPDLLLSGLAEQPHHPELVVPALLALDGSDELREQAYLTVLAYCDKGQLQRGLPAEQAELLVSAYRRALDDVTKLQQRQSWLSDKSYAGPRERASIFLDLFRCVPGDRVAAELTAALSNRDARLAYFAAKALTVLGRDVPDAALAPIAASSEMRIWLIEDLAKKHQVDRVPARYRTQAAIAESEMVRWLVYPTELGHVPDAITLGKTVTFDSDDGPLDVFVFKIKTDDGWVAGVAGPYVRKNEPTTESLGGTFSAFEPWASKTPDEHAAQVRDLIAKMNTENKADKRGTVKVDGADARDRK